MNKSENINELAAALSKAQGAITDALRDSNNPFFKSKYADLASVWDACRKPLADNGLAIIQSVTSSDGIALETMLTHSSGQFVSSTVKLLLKDESMQGMGSAITYARRYQLAAFVGVAPDDDDDGNAASGKTQPAKAMPVQPKPAEKVIKIEKPEDLDRISEATTHVMASPSPETQSTLGIGQAEQDKPLPQQPKIAPVLTKSPSDRKEGPECPIHHHPTFMQGKMTDFGHRDETTKLHWCFPFKGKSN